MNTDTAVDAPALIAGEHLPLGDDAAPILDPSHGHVIGRAARCGRREIDRAVDGAGGAGRAWGRRPARERAAVLRRLADLVERHAEDLATREARDGGRPIRRALDADVPNAAATFRYFAEAAKDVPERLERQETRDAGFARGWDPLGVAAIVLPFNMSLVLAAWNLAPALTAGCAAVVKPAEETALTVVRLAELALEAGVPPGALAVVPGLGEEAGAALVDHPGIDLVAFTGSVATGRHVAARAAARGAPTILELGGKNPLIVLSDADLESAARGALLAGFGNAGQACSAGSRILVQDEVAEPFLTLLVSAARRLRVGPALEPSVLMGPLISAEARTRVEGHLQRAREQGARIATGGARPSHVPEGGWYLEPTVLVDVPEDADCLREELFGPIVTVESFGDIDDALARANATPFGLTSGVWTTDPRLGRHVADALDAGTVWINRWHSYHPAAPFGGRGASGHGHVCGPHAVQQFLTPKTVWGAGASPG